MNLPTITVSLVFVASLLSWNASAQAQGAAAGNDALLLLLEQNRNLQAEVQALRALVEEQGFEVRKLQRESLDRYTDTDNRLRSLEQAAGAVVNPGAGGITSLPAQNGNAVSSSGAAGAADTTLSTTSRGLDTGSAGGASPAVIGSSSLGAATGTTPAPARNVRPSLEPVVLTEQQLYQMAYDSAINSKFEQAIAEFDQYLNTYPQGRFITNSHYWKGQSYLYLGRYNEAITEYGVILEQYQDDAKVPDSIYGQAVAYEGMGENDRARRLLQQIIRSYPNTGVANLADTRLRSLN